jgi:alpha-tubulin suppressor-like RCC1 family protein
MRKIIYLTSILCAFTSTAQCWKTISAGGNHVLAIGNNDKIWGWGSNFLGPLGLGAASGDQLNPVPCANTSVFSKISTGGNEFSIALKPDGTLWSTGLNDYGELGIGSNVNKSSFTQIGLATNWHTFSAGGLHTLALKTDGTLWSWGGNSEGQLGNNTMVDSNLPIQIGVATNWAIVSAGGYYFSAAIKTDGTLWTWGNDSFQQLGNGTVLSHQLEPLQIGIDTNWKTVSAGQYHTLALKTDGSLWAWGSNSYGALGDGTTSTRPAPIQIGNTTDWDKIVAGSFASYAIKTDGTLWSWGYNDYGQLGDGTTVHKSIPTQIGSDTNWADVSSKMGYYAIALKTDGSAWSWGLNMAGYLGDGTRTQRLSPVPITCPAALETEDFEKQTATLYPNPSNGVFAINSTENLKKIIAFDVLGKEIPVKTMANNQFLIEKSGLYFLKIELENSKIINSKISIN